MTGDQILLLAFAAGHVLLLILALNTAHGLGFNAKWMDDVVLATLAALGLSTFALVFLLWNRPVPSWPLPILAYGAVCLGTLGIGLPAVTLARLLRPLPAGCRAVGSRVEEIARGPPSRR